MGITRRVLLSAGACLVLATGARADTVQWDMPNEYGATSLPAEADRLFAERVNEKSGGKLVITNHFGGALGYKSRDHWSAVEDGAVPIASTYTGVFSGIDPIFELQSLPLRRHQSQGVEGAPRRDAPVARGGPFAKGGQMYLLGAPWTPVGIWAQKKITDAEGLRNLKIRSYDKTGTLTLKNAGAAAIQLSWADVVPALSTGTIEAVLTSDEGGLSAKFHEYMDHFHHVGFTMGTNMIHVSQAAFDDLSPELRQAVLDAARGGRGRGVGEHQRAHRPQREAHGRERGHLGDRRARGVHRAPPDVRRTGHRGVAGEVRGRGGGQDLRALRRAEGAVAAGAGATPANDDGRRRAMRLRPA